MYMYIIYVYVYIRRCTYTLYTYLTYTVEPLYNGQLGATIFVHYSGVSALEGLCVCMYLTICDPEICPLYRGVNYRGVSISYWLWIVSSYCSCVFSVLSFSPFPWSLGAVCSPAPSSLLQTPEGESRVQGWELPSFLPEGRAELAHVQLVCTAELHPGRRDGSGENSAVHCLSCGSVCELIAIAPLMCVCYNLIATTDWFWNTLYCIVCYIRTTNCKWVSWEV